MQVRKIFIFLVLLSSIVVSVEAQDITPQQYIERYKIIAIRDHFDYNIPAAITLAQGLLESGNGNSMLAVKANNHFGIKCHNDWTGKRIYKDDDAEDECFRVYNTPEESFIDHALFLTTKSRYEFLFNYKVTDYKAWAKGLKKAGYATNPKYPQRLIDIIERYDLAQYDKISLSDFKKMLILNGQNPEEVIPSDSDIVAEEKVVIEKGPHSILYRNRVRYIIVHEGEGVVDIARLFNVSPGAIYKYNDLKKGSSIRPGMMLYLQPKRRKGDVKFHAVQKGETLWNISQIHGIKLQWLLKRNGLEKGAQIKAGDKLYLKKNKR
jgi:hypothetical protein